MYVAPLKTVFICEDHPLFLRSLEQLVSNSAQLEHVDSADSVAGSLRKLPSARPDVVLLDLNLGNGDGFQVLEFIQEYLPQTMVMVLTSYNDPLLAKKAKRLGASAYMLKDSDEATLLEAILNLKPDDFVTNTAELATESAFEADNEFGSYLKLTRTEKKVVGELLKGASAAEVAETLFVSEHTVKNHKKNIYRKLGINKQSELILLCQRHGLLGK